MNSRLVAREHVLKEMLQSIANHDENTRIEDCDDCHAERAMVVIDPETMYCGEFVYCEQCIKQKLAAIYRKKRRDKRLAIGSLLTSPSLPQRGD